jgi:hypothetical protein
MARMMQRKLVMQGIITQRNWPEIERSFPGLHTFYSHLPRKPQTFLELLKLYQIYKQFTTRRRSVGDASLENSMS